VINSALINKQCLPPDVGQEGRVTREVPIVKFNSNAAVGIAVSPMGGTAEPATVVRVRQGIVAVTGDLPTRRVGAWQLT
jgi:hypothetical protein